MEPELMACEPWQALSLHRELEETIAEFKGTEAAITYTSGYVTNLTVMSTWWVAAIM